MTAVTRHSTPDPAVAVEQVAANYASVSEQIEECTANIAKADTNILAMQTSIREQREFKKREAARRAKLRTKRRIFAEARFRLQQVDEE